MILCLYSLERKKVEFRAAGLFSAADSFAVYAERSSSMKSVVAKTKLPMQITCD